MLQYIRHGEKHNLKESLSVIKNLSDKTSWFGEHAHRYPIAAFPMTNAMALVEVVVNKSEKATVIYKQITEGLSKPGINTIKNEMYSKLKEQEKEEIRNILKFPEEVFVPDAEKPFKDLEEAVNDPEFIKDLFKEEIDSYFKELARLYSLILKFIIIGFNRESDIKKRKYKVIPSEKAKWLILAVMFSTAFEYYNITQERLRALFKEIKEAGNCQPP